MISKDRKRTNKFMSIIGAIFIALLFLSTITVVPQVNGQPLMNKINQKEKLENLITKLSDTDDTTTKQSSSIISNLILRLISNILGDKIDLNLLQNLINGESENTLLQNIMQIIKGLISNENQTNNTPNNNTVMSFILSFLKAILSLTATLFKILINASVGLIGGLIRIISAFISIVLLFIAGAQTVFTLGAILMLFLGVMAKYGIKALSIIGAPIFALIAAQISISVGTILGGISTVIYSLLAILLLFALPLLIVGIVYLLLGNSEENDTYNGLDITLDHHRTGLFYMILSVIANSFSVDE